jgi:hypothetical protein
MNRLTHAAARATIAAVHRAAVATRTTHALTAVRTQKN